MTAEHIHQLRNRYRGALLGLACGDALGTTLEFHPPDTFNPLVTMIGGGPFRLKAGEWTDDTSMALCLGESLVECGGFEPVDQMQRYLRWWQDGYLSSTGRCFDVGIAVAAALGKYQNTGHPFAGSTDPRSAGNGSLTRLAPVVLAYRATPEQVIYYAVESSRTTHGAQTCLDACKLYAAMILAALDGASKGEMLSPGLYQGSLVPEVAEISAGSYKVKNPPAIVGSGYVVRSLEAALWAFYRSSSFQRGAFWPRIWATMPIRLALSTDSWQRDVWNVRDSATMAGTSCDAKAYRTNGGSAVGLSEHLASAAPLYS